MFQIILCKLEGHNCNSVYSILEMPPETDEESHSDETSSSSSCSCSEGDSDESSSSSSEDDSNESAGGNSGENDESDDDEDDEDSDDDSDSDEDEDEDEKEGSLEDSSSKRPKNNKTSLEQLQLVWAKCRGFPWYPALVRLVMFDLAKAYSLEN